MDDLRKPRAKINALWNFEVTVVYGAWALVAILLISMRYPWIAERDVIWYASQLFPAIKSIVLLFLYSNQSKLVGNLFIDCYMQLAYKRAKLQTTYI